MAARVSVAAGTHRANRDRGFDQRARLGDAAEREQGATEIGGRRSQPRVAGWQRGPRHGDGALEDRHRLAGAVYDDEGRADGVEQRREPR